MSEPTPIKHPSVSGLFYSDDPEQLEANINNYMKLAHDIPYTPKAIIAPHAGLVYSGPIAGQAYKPMISIKDKIKTVVLLGPAHFVHFQGIACHDAAEFETPLGNLKVNTKKLSKILKLPQVQTLPLAFEKEHSLEVQLPFLQNIFSEVEIVPLLVGQCKAYEVAQVINDLWDYEDTFVVISSDLSHYLSYEQAQIVDQQTVHCIEHLDDEHLPENGACGHRAIRGLLKVAKERGLLGKAVDLRNSGDTAGSKDRVVGYGAFIFY